VEEGELTMEIDRSLIGAITAPFEVEVEAGAIRRFVEAIGDPNPLYRDATFARARGFAGIVAPPTFPVSFRPPSEPVWTASLDRRRVLAGEQSFTYRRPIVAGDVLTCEIRFVRVDDKQGRAGRMELLVQTTTGRDRAGVVVFTHDRTMVYREARAA